MILAKSVTTTVVLALAVLQALEMAQVQGKVRWLPIDSRRLRRAHRLGGVAVLGLAVLVALVCIVTEGHPAPGRVLAHAVMGGLAVAVLLTKVVITRRFRRLLRYNGLLGATAGLLLAGTFFFSAFWYFFLY